MDDRPVPVSVGPREGVFSDGEEEEESRDEEG